LRIGFLFGFLGDCKGCREVTLVSVERGDACSALFRYPAKRNAVDQLLLISAF
jgi:hypothetical protein